MCVPSLLSCTTGTWPRNTSGRCRRTSRPPAPPASCSLCRSTSDRSRRRRGWCRCTVARGCPGYRAWDSSRRTPATAPGRRGPSARAACAPDCTASAESCSVAGARDRRDAGGRSCSPSWRAHCCARDPNCWPSPGRRRRSDPSDYRRPRGNSAAASSKFSPYTSPTYRDTCTPDAFPKTRAVTRRRRNPVTFLLDSQLNRWYCIRDIFSRFTFVFGSFIWINDEFDKFKERDKIEKNVIYYKFCNILRLKRYFLFHLELEHDK